VRVATQHASAPCKLTISSHLFARWHLFDYCNGVLYGITTTNLRPLQSVINATARLINGKRKFDHITNTLRDDLHWLPVR